MNRPATMRGKFSSKRFQYYFLIGITGSALAASADQSADQDQETRPQNAFEHYLGLHKVSAEEDDWTRHFRLGAVVGLNISASFKTSGNFNISGNNAANGIYDDGYVRLDQSGDTDYTSYWGYNNRSSQYDAANQKLTMHRGASYSLADSSNGSANSDPTVGLDLAYGGNLWYWHHVRIGWEFGFGLLPISISDPISAGANVTQVAYAFDTSNLGIFFPSASSYHADPNGTDRFISTAYTTSTNTPSGGGNGTVSGTRTLDVMLYTLRLGPTFYGDLFENVAVSFGAGPAIGIVDGRYKYDETITAGGVSSHNSGGFDATDVVFGGYVNTTLMYHFVDNKRNADVYISAQYMPMSGANFSRDGREGRLNLSGQVYLSVGLNWPF
jgi:hypothetical protein